MCWAARRTAAADFPDRAPPIRNVKDGDDTTATLPEERDNWGIGISLNTVASCRVASSAVGSVHEPVDFVDGEVPGRRNEADAMERAVYVPIPLRILPRICRETSEFAAELAGTYRMEHLCSAAQTPPGSTRQHPLAATLNPQVLGSNPRGGTIGAVQRGTCATGPRSG